jgi:hypothetical protein
VGQVREQKLLAFDTRLKKLPAAEPGDRSKAFKICKTKICRKLTAFDEAAM